MSHILTEKFKRYSKALKMYINFKKISTTVSRKSFQQNYMTYVTH